LLFIAFGTKITAVVNSSEKVLHNYVNHVNEC
jgi:hypothetical protein